MNKSYFTLYVDVENLMELAKEAVTAVIDKWPDDLPRLDKLRLYVRADQAELLRVWAADKFASLDINVIGVQHYSVSASKNSADIALALDAITDLLKGRTNYVGILSDDSDFATLFSKISQEFVRQPNVSVPFIWFMTDRNDTRSSILDRFFPARYIRTVVCDARKPASPPKRTTRASSKAPIQKVGSTASDDDLAQAIIRNIPIGSFKSTDCVIIMKKYFPEHPLTNLNPAAFGTKFFETVWPSLEKYGVRIANPNRKPIRYEMTETAKQQFGTAA